MNYTILQTEYYYNYYYNIILHHGTDITLRQ